MAGSRIASPGTENGPCEGTCGHIDCAETRKMANAVCTYCQETIGYNRGFYNLEGKQMVHSSCHEDAIEEERKLVEIINLGAIKK